MASPDPWHRRLLDRMAIATDSRPAVLSPEVRAGLAELLAFRHAVRHLYAYDLDGDGVNRVAASMDLAKLATSVRGSHAGEHARGEKPALEAGEGCPGR